MSSWLRPRRGKFNSAKNKLNGDNKLTEGEIFFEVPDTGVGTGQGKIKMGDGVTTSYEALPYFINLDGYLKLDTTTFAVTTGSQTTIDNCLTEITNNNKLTDKMSATVKAIDLLNNNIPNDLVNGADNKIYLKTSKGTKGNGIIVNYIDDIQNSTDGITYRKNGSTTYTEVIPGYATIAEKAKALDNGSTAIGSTTKGVYFDANGKAKAMSYSVNKTVPSDAKFTDTTYDTFASDTNGLVPKTNSSTTIDHYLSGIGWTKQKFIRQKYEFLQVEKDILAQSSIEVPPDTSAKFIYLSIHENDNDEIYAIYFGYRIQKQDRLSDYKFNFICLGKHKDLELDFSVSPPPSTERYLKILCKKKCDLHIRYIYTCIGDV